MWKCPLVMSFVVSVAVGCSSSATNPVPMAVPPVAQQTAAQPAHTPIDSSTPASFFQRAVGPGSGWIIGARQDLIQANRVDLATKANEAAEQHPATSADVNKSDTADLNNDGFLTLDEVLALKRAGLDSRQIIQRISRTPQQFSISARQQQYLLDRGINQPLIDAIQSQQAAAPASASPVR